MESVFGYIRWTYNWLIDLILPEKCLGCGAKGDIICESCLARTRRTERQTENGIFACLDYRDALVKKIIWSLKYYNRKSLGQKLGNLLYDTLLEEIADLKLYMGQNPIYVIPVPMSKKRQRERGYNQADIIARNLCKESPGKILELRKNIVLKKATTLPQAKISNRKQRLSNIKDSFYISDKSFVRGQIFIVVDDVTTTGGTIMEIVRVLKKFGAKKVIGFAVAH